MKRLSVVVLVLACLSGHANAARPTTVAKLRRAAAVAVVGAALLSGPSHAADLKTTIDEVTRPAYAPGMVIPKDLTASSSFPSMNMDSLPSASTSAVAVEPARFRFSIAPRTDAKRSATSLAAIASNLVLGEALGAAQQWSEKSNSPLAKFAVLASDPSHVGVNVKPHPASISIQYHASFR